MSKSLKNTVDPEEMIEQYGADTARWFVLSDSPPERDVEWSEAGIEGAWKFVNRLWRLVEENIDALPEIGAAETAQVSDDEQALRKATHKTIAAVTDDIDAFRFNRAVARIYELANAISGYTQKSPKNSGFALREALEAIVQMVAPMMPHFAEEAWEKLGHGIMVIDTPWPQADAALTRDDEVTLPIQVNGKRRGEISVAKDADAKEVETLALGVDTVIKYIGDKPVRKVIVVPNRIVNIVV